MKSMLSRCIAACLATSLLAGPALAQPRSGKAKPSEKDKQIASDLVKKAIAKSQAGDHPAAIDIYLQAYTIVPNSILLSNIGAEYQQSGKDKEALRYFCLYLEKDPEGTNATYATARAKALRSELEDRKVSDEEACAPDKPKPVEEVDERPTKTERRSKRDLEDKPVDEGATTAVDDGAKWRYSGLAVGGAGVVALGVGIYAGIHGAQLSKDYDDGIYHGRTPADAKAYGERWNNIQIGTLVAGGALAITGVLLYVHGMKPDAPQDKTVVHVAPTHNGFAVFGSF